LFSGVVSSTTAFFVVVVGGSAVASQRWLFVFGDVLVLRFADWIPDLLRFAGLILKFQVCLQCDQTAAYYDPF
jgi:hypothetical protein